MQLCLSKFAANNCPNEFSHVRDLMDQIASIYCTSRHIGQAGIYVEPLTLRPRNGNKIQPVTTHRSRGDFSAKVLGKNLDLYFNLYGKCILSQILFLNQAMACCFEELLEAECCGLCDLVPP